MGKFNFAAAREAAKKALDSKTLGVIILGPSGAGKSYLCGTLPGKILYLFTDAEGHGPKGAKANGGDVDGLQIDKDDDGNALNADQSYQRLLDILSDVDGIVSEGFNSIVIDSLTEVEAIIRQTGAFKRKCETNTGKHNSFQEPAATIEMFRPILAKLRDLSLRHDIHYAVTCPLTVQALGDDGQVLESSPRLSGYAVADNLILQFPDVLLVGQVEVKGKIGHCLQFNSNSISKQSSLGGLIKKLVNFSPRITGVKNPPQLMAANLSKVIEMKEKGNVQTS